jgi:hypothetical protein
MMTETDLQQSLELTPEESLKLMRKAVSQFYTAAVMTQAHAFIEFTGLMTEYIKVCEKYQQDNPREDFRKLNQHTGQALKLEHYHVDYILEKLTCIYQEEIVGRKNNDD